MGSSGGPVLTKIVGELHDVADAWVSYFPAGDLLDGPTGHATTLGDLWPSPLCFFQLGKDELVNGFFHIR